MKIYLHGSSDVSDIKKFREHVKKTWKIKDLKLIDPITGKKLKKGK